MTRNMGVNVRWCRRIKRMNKKLLKSTGYNRLHLQQCGFSQHLSPLQLCKDMFLLNYYYLLHKFPLLWHHSLQFNPV